MAKWKTFDAGQVRHKHGVPWDAAPLPGWLHECIGQTIELLDGGGPHYRIELRRCACGARQGRVLRVDAPSAVEPWGDDWQGRNERRRLKRAVVGGWLGGKTVVGWVWIVVVGVILSMWASGILNDDMVRP